MASDLFDHAAERLERHTDLDRLEARGTLRLAIKQAGLATDRLTLHQLGVVFEKVMPAQLDVRGTSASTSVCRAVMDELSRVSIATAATNDSDEIFQRLGGK